MPDAQTHLNEARAHIRSGNTDQACDALQRAIRTARRPEELKQAAGLARQAGAAELVSDATERNLEFFPANPQARALAGEAAMAAELYARAIPHFEAAVRAFPGEPRFRKQLSKALYEHERFAEAMATFRPIAEGGMPTGDELLTYARLALNARDLDTADVYSERALAALPKSAPAHVTRARVLVQRGELEEAETLLDAALELDPDCVEAHLNRAELISPEADDPLFERLEALMDSGGLSLEDRSNLGFALGQMYHKAGEPDRAFARYKTGNEATARLHARAGVQIDMAGEAGAMARIRAQFDPETLQALTEGEAGPPADGPVFIVGMPRSGTTLLEQIIAAHPRVEPMGELETIRRLYHRLDYTAKGAEDIRTMVQAHRASDRAEYERGMPADAPMATDKMPVNFLYLGYIRALFPAAPVIHIRRDPVDTCLSIYFRNFPKAYPYATDLAALGQYYRLYVDHMEYWRKHLPGGILDVSYEALVSEPEARAKEVIAHLDLNWDPACLKFQERRNKAFTMSAVQVRKPISTAAVGRWRRYEKHLGPLLEALGDLAERG